MYPQTKTAAHTQKAFKQAMRLMGNQFEITLVTDTEEQASYYTALAVAEIKRIEALFTTFDENSETNLINKNAGIQPVTVSKEVYQLIERAIRISKLTDGAFDITYGSIDKSLWNFDTNMTQLPNAETAKKAVRLINYRNIILDASESAVFLKEQGMRIGFGGIGKGYAAERAKRILQENGITSGIVNASGDLTAWGHQADGKPWTIGIADPEHSNTPFSYLDITNLAAATSGSYEKFAVIDGRKYSHTINPKTGLPVTGIKSVTIICPNAEIADAMATPVTVMGVSKGLNLINQMKDIACIIIDDSNRLYTSDNIKLVNS
jgi:FAD:protein FMN transferase